MDKQTNLHECVARHTRDILMLFPQKALKYNEISPVKLDKINDFVIEYYEDVSVILLEMAAECIEIGKKI